MSGPFKLKSGNTPPFKQMGEKKETPEQYNARVKAEYDAKMQSYQDSTASYQNQLEIRSKMNEAFSQKHEEGQAEYRVASGQKIIDAKGKIEGTDWDKTKDTKGNPIDPKKTYSIPLANVTEEQKAENKRIKERNELKFQKSERLIDESFVLHGENVERGIHAEGVHWGTRGDKNVNDLRPTVPKEPVYMVPRMAVKNIDLPEHQITEQKPIPSYRTDIIRTYKDYGGGTKKGHKKPIVVKYKDGSSKRVSQEHYNKNIAPYYNNK